jgi:hypothetical protein
MGRREKTGAAMDCCNASASARTNNMECISNE